MRIGLAFLLIATSFGCSSGPALDSSTPEGSFALGEKYEKDERYEEAIQQFSRVKSRHPYHSLATESELRIADIYFKREDFAEAQAAYQTFKELHPSHPRSDYVTYQLAMSIVEQLPSTIDRDLSLADRAILYLDEVIASFAQSAYAGPAKNEKVKVLRKLAEKELYIADFYFKRDKFDSALTRYEDLLAKYPGQGLDAQALSRAAISAHRMKDPERMSKYIRQLENQYPGSMDLKRAKEVIRE